MMECYYCQKEINGKGNKKTLITCHPSTPRYEVKICLKCHHFPSNNVESKERLIK